MLFFYRVNDGENDRDMSNPTRRVLSTLVDKISMNDFVLRLSIHPHHPLFVDHWLVSPLPSTSDNSFIVHVSTTASHVHSSVTTHIYRSANHTFKPPLRHLYTLKSQQTQDVRFNDHSRPCGIWPTVHRWTYLSTSI